MPLETHDDSVTRMIREDGRCTAVLNVTKPRESFEFRGVDEAPVPSLLRGFSAPVKIQFDYTRDDLVFLMSHDSDGFNRWEAGQRLSVDVIQEVIGQIHTGAQPSVDDRLIRAFETILDQSVEHHGDASLDKAMVADMLLMPGEAYLAELSVQADVDAIHRARDHVRCAIATSLGGILLSVYKLNLSDEPYRPTGDECPGGLSRTRALGIYLETRELMKRC